MVKGKPLYFLLDTGVNPSVIDLSHAQALGLPLDFKAAGQGNGEGPGTTLAIPSKIPSPQIGGQQFETVDALATDMNEMSAAYGHHVDGVLGYSFLTTNSVLVDYLSHSVTIVASGQGRNLAPRCRTAYSMPFISNNNDQFPVISSFRLGSIEAPVTLDTGSNRTIGLYLAALQLPGIRKALIYRGTEKGHSFGGGYMTMDAILKLPMSVGPFALPAGQPVSIMLGKGIPGKRVANRQRILGGSESPTLDRLSEQADRALPRLREISVAQS